MGFGGLIRPVRQIEPVSRFLTPFNQDQISVASAFGLIAPIGLPSPGQRWRDLTDFTLEPRYRYPLAETSLYRTFLCRIPVLLQMSVA